MNPLLAASLKYQNGELLILDQYLLPHQQVWHHCNTVADLVSLIQALKVRGAPLIGLSAAILVAKLATEGASKQQLHDSITTLRAARPTAVNLMNCMAALTQALTAEDYVSAVVKCAEQLFDDDVAMCDSMADHGAELVKANDQILTHCNTGALATAGIGTALGVIYRAHQQNKHIHVWVDETRPLLQGGRLTSYELDRWQIPYKLICDNMAASIMAQGLVDKIFVGADRIAANGDFANKVGTYNLAVLAHYHAIPFYVVAPWTTVDKHCASGKDIPIEQRAPAEVKGVSGSFGQCQWAPDSAPVINPAFDITPAHLVSGWVLDTGVYRLADIEQSLLNNDQQRLS